jgi:hypothetical protein
VGIRGKLEGTWLVLALYYSWDAGDPTFTRPRAYCNDDGDDLVTIDARPPARSLHHEARVTLTRRRAGYDRR